MLAWTLALVLALVACARAGCDACVAGVCHSRQTLLKGFRVTDQLALDRARNVLYTQLDDDQNIALSLDRPGIRLLHTMRTSGMAVDQQTQTLYLGTKEVAKTFYKHYLENNMTEAVLTKLDDMKPDVMFYNRTIYFIEKDSTSVMHFNQTAKAVWHKTRLENYTITDFVLDKDDKIFLVSNDKVYVFDPKAGSGPPRVISQKNQVLSADGFGEVYFGDVSQKVIYTRDNRTGKIKLYASYKSAAVEDFVFDRDNNIVFRDAAGGVARWLPAPARARCRVEPPHQDHLIRELSDDKTRIQ